MATFENRATLSYNGRTTDSNVVTGEILEVLSVTKTAVRGEYAPGGSVTYVISIVNTGAVPAADLTVTDDLGAYAFGAGTRTPLTYTAGTIQYYVNGALQTAPAVTAGPPLSVTGITVPAGGSVTLLYEAAANEFAPLAAESTIRNTAAVSGGGLTAPLSASETVGALSEARLSVCKSLSPAAVAENGTLTYTFVIQNSGSAAAGAGDAIVLADTFDPRLSNLTVTYDGAPLAAPADYTYNAATGEFATVAGRITVPAASFAQDAATGAWSVTPGVGVLTVTGTV